VEGANRAAGATAVAAVDCGTNSTRLLVADPDGRTLERLMTITRFGQGVDRTHVLAPEAVVRTVDVLRRYRTVMDRHGVGRVRMTATSAARDATNRDDFFGPAREVIGVEAELLGGDEEGRLSYAGATAELDPSTGPWLVADIGGGSTELAVGGSDRLAAEDAPLGPSAVRSLDMGCVRITERFLLHDPPTRPEMGAARAWVDTEVEKAITDQPAFLGAAVLVGLAGTVAAAASLDQRLERYDRDALHHYPLATSRVRSLLVELAGETAAGRRRRPGMEAQRADVIVGGLIVLDALLTRFGFSECLTSEADILDGLVRALIATS
jgi:exopolyphosphatase/guanosine-5'-triphosphate,3'-diphosphate pyrophosphatase